MTIQTVWDIANQINMSLGITPFDAYDIWRQSQIVYYTNNIPSPIARPVLQAHNQYVFDMLNSYNTVYLSPSDFVLGTPGVFSDSKYNNVNTSITLTAATLTGYTGTAAVYYNRIDIATILSKQTYDLQISSLPINATDLISILPLLNANYGTDILASDIINIPVPTIVNGVASSTIHIQIDSNSLKYTGSYDYIINYANSIPIINAIGPNNILTVYSGVSSITNMVIETNILGTIDTGYSFGRNVTNLVSASITDIHRDITTGNIIITGILDLTYTSTGITNTGIYKSIITDSTGLIISSMATDIFNIPANYAMSINRNDSNVYAFSTVPVNNLSPGLIQYPLNSISTPLNLPALLYVANLVFSQTNGNIYIVSPQYTAIPPFPGNLVPINVIRIDRLNSLGVLDSTFNPVYLTSSDNISNVPMVTDILESNTGIYIALNQSTGYGVGTNTVCVNSVPIVTTGPTKTAMTPWIPIISLLLNGLTNPSFTNTLSGFNESILSIDTTKTNYASKWLNQANGYISILAYINNPITGLPGYYLNRLNIFGNIIPYSSSAYLNLLAYSSLSSIETFIDGGYLLTGDLSSININGQYTASKSFCSYIHNDSTEVSIAPIPTGTIPPNTITIVKSIGF